MDNLELLIGLLAIAVAIFFGLREFRKGVTTELSTIKDAVVATRTTVEKIWDIVALRFAPGSGTVERNLENLGKVKITAQPAEKATSYLIEIENPILVEGMIVKLSRETGLAEKEKQMFSQETRVFVLSRTRMRMEVPSTEPKLCTEYITFFLKWVDSTYVASLTKIKEYEEPILK